MPTFTIGSRTVILQGSVRTFQESQIKIIHDKWVRLLPSPFNGVIDEVWLNNALTDTSPDVLQVAMQYINNAPSIYDKELQIAGDANYGPLLPNGSRQEGSDFSDYLGIPWTYNDTIDNPETNQFKCLDCSGYIRMIFGYRFKLPLSLNSNNGESIPRRAYQMCESAPGIMVIPNNNIQIKDFSLLQPGDLVFFDVDNNDGNQIDHVGMYMGLDTNNQHRFISSRKKANGPTMGDMGGKSTLDGNGFYAIAFKAVRRL